MKASNMARAIKYKVATERGALVIRSHDCHFLYHLTDVIDGNPTHPDFAEEVRVFAGAVRKVLNGEFGAFTQEL